MTTRHQYSIADVDQTLKKQEKHAHRRLHVYCQSFNIANIASLERPNPDMEDSSTTLLADIAFPADFSRSDGRQCFVQCR